MAAVSPELAGARRNRMAASSNAGRTLRRVIPVFSLLLCSALSGCATCGFSSKGCEAPSGRCHAGRAQQCTCELPPEAPRELRKVSLPEYTVEPPDVLLIEAVHNIRTVQTPVQVGEALLIQATDAVPLLPDDDMVSAGFKHLNGYFVIGADGYVNLGPEYGKVLVADQPLDEVQRRLDEHLRQIAPEIQLLVTLPAPQNRQIVAGPHLVRPDGTVGLGIYGNVYVTGLTLTQARQAVEQHLSRHIHQPQVSVDVLSYESKVYYVITDGGGAGEQVYRIPTTGNETVLDAMARVNGLPTVASKDAVWIARPSPYAGTPDQILKVDWNAVARGAQTATNYQVLPGDRIYVNSTPMIAFDTKLSIFTAPIERILGMTILGNSTVRSLNGEDVGF
jgi:polysaccharide export outer membrane protein